MYEVKTKISLFQRLFKIKKNGVYFLVRSSLILEIGKLKGNK